MVLLTAGGMLVAQSGLSARAQTTTAQTALGAGSGTKTNQPPSSGGQNTSPGTNQNCVAGNQTRSQRTAPFVAALPIMPTAATVALTTFSPQPTDAPNTASGADGSEVRAFAHQGPTNYPNQFPHANGLSRYYKFRQVQFTTNRMSPNLPAQTIWGFDDGTHGPHSPGPTYQANYGKPQMTRNINALPLISQKNNTGFGMASVTTHLHNRHTPS